MTIKLCTFTNLSGILYLKYIVYMHRVYSCTCTCLQLVLHVVIEERNDLMILSHIHVFISECTCLLCHAVAILNIQCIWEWIGR